MKITRQKLISALLLLAELLAVKKFYSDEKSPFQKTY